MFSIDTFLKGAKEPCEDYILAGSEPAPHIILSDGCSSERHTDVGARLLAHALKRYAIDEQALMPVYRAITATAACAETLRLPEGAMTATLGLIRERGDSLWAHLYGDGIVFYALKGEKTPRWFRVEYEGNMPCYPCYLLDRETKKLFEERDRRAITGDGYQAAASLFESVVGETVCLLPTMMVRYVGIASDGLGSFGLSVQEVLTDICQFKGAGKRLQRRMNRVLRDYAVREITPGDDLSVGVLFNEEMFGESAG